MPEGLAELRARISEDLEILAYPTPDWVSPRAAPDGSIALDCAIIGGGQYGLTLAAGLRRERVGRIAVFDAAPQGLEGPWRSFARMAMLRTPKTLTGTELGIPSLSFRAWWEAQHGQAGWEAVFRIPRTAWMDYLDWLRATLDLPVRNRWALIALEPVEGGALLRLRFATPEGEQTIHAATCILATGAAGSGGYAIPAEVAERVPAERLVHANDSFDVARFAGQRIAVLGAGASGFDTAAAALRAGARAAAVCFRRASLPGANPRRWMENAGFLAQYVALPDARKWGYMRHLLSIGQGPPKPTYDDAIALLGFSLHAKLAMDSLTYANGTISLRCGDQTLQADALVVATGLRVNLADRPELAAVAAHAALWEDRFQPAPGQESAALGRFPYLDQHGAFTERHPGTAPWLDRVLTITRGAVLSLGPVSASNSGMKYTAPRLIEGVKRRLLLDQEEQDWAAFLGQDHAELPIPTAEPIR